MRRSSRVYLNDLNPGKTALISEFLHLAHDITQYFVDLFWQRGDGSSVLADLETVHKGCERFGISTRLSQAFAKQAKEAVRGVNRRWKEDDSSKKWKPRLRNHTVNLCYHFVTIEPYNPEDGLFDYAINLGGAGVPQLIVPCKSTKHLNSKLKDGWKLGNSIRLGRDGSRLWVDFILEKPKPQARTQGEVLGIDSNYKAGLVTSAAQFIGKELHYRIQEFSRRQRNTHEEIRSIMFHALKGLDLSDVRLLCIEALKYVRFDTRGKFPRAQNRRMSHWFYKAYSTWLKQHCEELGIQFEKKGPWKTSQCCSSCGKWDRRNRKGDTFCCIYCGHQDHADLNAAKVIKILGLAGVYGLRLLKNPEIVFKHYGSG